MDLVRSLRRKAVLVGKSPYGGTQFLSCPVQLLAEAHQCLKNACWRWPSAACCRHRRCWCRTRSVAYPLLMRKTVAAVEVEATVEAVEAMEAAEVATVAVVEGMVAVVEGMVVAEAQAVAMAAVAADTVATAAMPARAVVRAVATGQMMVPAMRPTTRPITKRITKPTMMWVGPTAWGRGRMMG